MNHQITTKRTKLSDVVRRNLVNNNKNFLPHLCAALTLPLCAANAMAEENKKSSKEEADIEVIMVEGYRKVMVESIAEKRDETAIVDAVSTEDIGNLPATSLANVINTLPGAAITRQKGSGTEVSIRGLGPKLGATRFNGRDATNGTGNRTVNFSLFPSELVNKIKVYKSQRADLVEGGISGVVEIGSLRPLDYGKQRVQLDLKGSYSENAANMDNAEPWGGRVTFSLTDQYELGSAGDLGVSFGVQRYEVSNPQDRMYGSSAWYACDAEYTPEHDGRRYPRCNDSDKIIDIDGDNRNNPFFLTSNSYAIVQQGEEDIRDAVFSTIQYIPNDDLEFNVDLQYSERDYWEDRHQLVFEDTRRIGPDPLFTDNGALLAYTATSLISTQPRSYHRNEEFQGWGFNTKWHATDDLTLEFDVSHSSTTREDFDRRVRLRSAAKDINGVESSIREEFPGYRGEVPIIFDIRDRDVPSIYVDERFDITNHDLFNDSLYLRRDSNLTENEIDAMTFDATYALDNDVIHTLKAGVRVANMTYARTTETKNYSNRNIAGAYPELYPEGYDAVNKAVNSNCRMDFPQDDFLQDASGAAIKSWATFDIDCVYQGFTGANNIELPEKSLNPGLVGVEEDTYAAYVMAEFETEIGDMPLSGNFGARFVQTENTSNGIRTGYSVVGIEGSDNIMLEPNGNIVPVLFEHETFDFLPSVNVNLELQDDLVLRGAAYRSLSRPDPSKLGAGRKLSVFGDNDGVGYESVSEAVNSIVASGSPGLEPLRAVSYDLSLEWYANEDTLVAGAVYYKEFEGGAIGVVNDETYTIAGESVTVPVAQTKTTDEKSELTGVEFSFSHVMSYLPEPFDGLGFKGAYNVADTDYETHDIRWGDQVIEGEFVEGIIEPAHLSGFSEKVASAQIFYKIGGLQLQGIYKYRSPYHFDFLAGNNQLRIIDASEVVDMRVSYYFNKHFKLTAEARNLFNEPVVHDMPVEGSQRDYQTYGTTYYLGLRINL